VALPDPAVVTVYCALATRVWFLGRCLARFRVLFLVRFLVCFRVLGGAVSGPGRVRRVAGRAVPRRASTPRASPAATIRLRPAAGAAPTPVPAAADPHTARRPDSARKSDSDRVLSSDRMPHSDGGPPSRRVPQSDHSSDEARAWMPGGRRQQVRAPS